MNTKYPVAMLFIAFFLSFVARTGSTLADDISVCSALNQANTVYTLTQNITDSSATKCMEITATNITLDCQGHAIDGTDTASTFGIYYSPGSSTNSNHTIKNCVLTDWGEYGIYFGEANYNTLTNNTANSNSHGIHLVSSSNNILTNNTGSLNTYRGFYIESSSNNVLTNNTANSNLYGFFLETSSNSTFTDNTMADNTYNFHVTGSQDSHFNHSVDTSNTVNGKPIYYLKSVENQTYSDSNIGYFACIFCDNVTVENLSVSKNGQGVLFWKTNNSFIRNSNLSSNYYGAYLESSSYNSLVNNTANSNFQYGFYIYQNSNNNTLTNNTANSNAFGFYLRSNSNNTMRDNRANSNTYGLYAYLSSNNTFTDNIISSNQHGFFFKSSSNNILTNNTAESNNQDGFYLYSSSNNNVLTNNRAESNNNYGFIIYSSSNNNVLTNNTAVNNDDEGFYFESTSNNIIIDNTASSNDYGFYLYSSSNNNVLTNNTAVNNEQDGFYLRSNSNNTFTSNTAESNGNRGFYLYSSSNNNVLTNNTAVNNGDSGFYFYSSSYNNITNNTAVNNNDGFLLTASSSNNNFTNNTAESNDVGGFRINSGSNVFTNNTAVNNEQGFMVMASACNFTNNIMTNNTYNLHIDGISDLNMDTSNSVDGKPVYYLKNVEDETYDSSTNAGYFACMFCNNITVRDLNFTKIGQGIQFVGTNNSRIINNTVDTALDAVYILNSHNNTFINNTAESRGNYGFYFKSSSTNNTLTNNIAKNTNQCFFFMTYSSYNNITNNTAENCGTSFGISSSKYNRLTDNMARNSTHGFRFDSSSTDNTIFNNYLENTNNAYDETSNKNYWNTTKDCSRTNIIGGDCIGGNYYSDVPSWDTDGDGIGDTPHNRYNISGGSNADYLPLTNYTENTPSNAPTLSSPAQDSVGVSTSSVLIVTVSDRNLQAMNVSFYNAADGSQIGSMQTNVASASSANVTWLGLKLGTTYQWYVNVTDGINTTTSSTWNFTTRAINVSLFSPASNTNVTKDRFFTFTVNVSCFGLNCGEINVSLDPEIGTGVPALWGGNRYDMSDLDTDCTDDGDADDVMVCEETGDTRYYVTQYREGNPDEGMIYCNPESLNIYELYECSPDEETCIDPGNPLEDGEVDGLHCTIYDTVADMGKGLVNATTGATPFYTTDDNPQTISLSAGESQMVSWRVNATGDLSSTYTFFATAFRTAYASDNYTSDEVDIGIFSMPVILQLNGTEGNKTYTSGEVANITASIDLANKTVVIEADFNGTSAVISQGINSTSNTTDTSNLNAGTYNITAYFAGDTEYSSSSTTYFLSVLGLAGHSCSANAECLSGYCVHGTCRSASTYCGDGHCDSGETCTSCSSDCGACAVLPGGGASAAPPTPPSKTQVWTIITPGAAQVMKVEKPEIGLKTIEIEVENKATSVEIKVEKLESKPAEVVHEVSSTTAEVKTYRYFQITHKNIEQQLKKAFLDFYVEKTWMDEGNIDPNTVALNRYTTDWDKLPTEKVSEDDDYIYYKAETTGFSVFAITGEEKKAAPPAEVPKECLACPQVTAWSECAAGKQTRTNYKCSADTGYKCESYIQEQSCEAKPPVKPKPEVEAPEVRRIPTMWLVGIVACVAVVTGVLTSLYMKKTVSQRAKKEYGRHPLRKQ